MYLLNNRRKWFERRRPEGAAIPMSECVITVDTPVQYTGIALYPAVVVKYGDDVLVRDVDYALTYKDNVNLGNGTVTVTGVGAFTGRVVKTFAVVSGGGGTEEPWYDFEVDRVVAPVTSTAVPDDPDYGVSPTVENMQVLPNGNISFCGVLTSSGSTVRRVYEMTPRIVSPSYVSVRNAPACAPASSSVVFSSTGTSALVYENQYMKSVSMPSPYDTDEAGDLFDGGFWLDRFFAFGKSGNAVIYKMDASAEFRFLELSEKWNLRSRKSAAGTAHNLTSIVGETLTWRSFCFSPDGRSALFTSGSGRFDIHKFSLGTPWDMSTMARTSVQTLIGQANNVIVDAVVVLDRGERIIVHERNQNRFYEYKFHIGE